MKNALFLLILLLALPTGSAIAASDIVAKGGSCTTLGASQMSTDQTEVVICLKSTTNGALIWKSMTGGGQLTCKRVISSESPVSGSAPTIYQATNNVYGDLYTTFLSPVNGQDKSGNAICQEVWPGSTCINAVDPSGGTTIQCNAPTSGGRPDTVSDDVVTCCKVE